MKIAIITDQHFGARKNSKLFHDYFLKFYDEVFFPALEEHGITHVIDMGDTFDSRKGIDFAALAWAKDNYYDRLNKIGCEVTTIVGNHTAYYKNTNNINAVDLLLREYDNVYVVSEPTEMFIGGLKVLLLPWMNSENEEKTFKMIQNTTAKVAMGHLELQGFRVNHTLVMEHGQDSKIFDSFTKVFSGHYHTRSTNGTVFYLGNPYEIYWTDVNDTRGFTIFDTETLEHEHINNPYYMFSIINYEDTPYQTFDSRKYEDKIVKLVVKKKSNQMDYEKFIDKLYSSNVAELKIIENFQVEDLQDYDEIETEDTLSILNRYIQESEVDMDKTLIQKLIKDVYKEACEMI